MNSACRHSRFRNLALSILLLAIIGSACQHSGEKPTPGILPTGTQSIPQTQTPPSQSTLPASLPSATPTEAGCEENSGTLFDRSLESSVLGESLDFKVYLPPCYGFDKGLRYSVLYMLHGQTSSFDQWVNLGLLSAMDDLLKHGLIDPFILVLPNETRSNVDGNNSKYGQSLAEELVPFIDENYRTCSERQCRAIGGLSRGGNWAVHLGFERPDLFTAVGAHSAPLFYGEITTVRYAASDKETASALPVFYIDVGNKDEDLADVQKFVQTLQEFHSVAYEFNSYLGYHNEAYWSAHVSDYLLWYANQLHPPYEN